MFKSLDLLFRPSSDDAAFLIKGKKRTNFLI